jgi:hypothetical protein
VSTEDGIQIDFSEEHSQKEDSRKIDTLLSDSNATISSFAQWQKQPPGMRSIARAIQIQVIVAFGGASAKKPRRTSPPTRKPSQQAEFTKTSSSLANKEMLVVLS